MKLRGKLVFFEFMEEGGTVYTIAQVSQIIGLNPALDEHPVRTIIKRENCISSISGELDINVATIRPKASYMLLPSNFANKNNQSEQSYTLVPTIVGSVPPTDTLVYLINENFLDQLFSKYLDRFFYVGNAYLSNVKIPLMFRHFGTGKFGMANDAYHLLVTAKTGAGKTTISKMISIRYAMYPEMAQFIIDPAGEFANNARGSFGTEMFRLNLKQIYQGLDRVIKVYNARDLVLDTWDLFEYVLYRVDFFKTLTVDSALNRKKACKVLREELQGNVTLTNLWTRQSFEKVMILLRDENIQKQIFKGKEARQRFDHFVDLKNNEDTYVRYWQPFASLFRENQDGKINISSLTNQVFDLTSTNRPIVVIDLSSREEGILEWDDNIEKLVIKRLLQKIYHDSRRYYQEGRSLNCLVMLDEAHRFANKEVDASSEKSEMGDQKGIVATLKQYVRETRKFGIGWMFVSTSLADLDESIVSQTGVRIFGYGLNMGSELERLKDCVTDQTDLDFYLAFPNPLNSLEEEYRIYPFMITGPCSPFSNTSSPMFVTAFRTPEDFKRANRLGA